MATVYTHTSLVEALKNYMEDLDQDFLAVIDNIVLLAEIRTTLDLSLQLDDVSLDTLGRDSSEEFLIIPEDCINVQSVYNPVTKLPLLPRAESFVQMMQDNLPRGDPEFWSRTATDRIFFAPKYDANFYNLRTRVTKLPEHLTSTNINTWLASYKGDLLFVCCLVECEKYMKNTQELAKREEEYQSLLSVHRGADSHGTKRKYTPLTAGPAAGVDPPLAPGMDL